MSPATHFHVSSDQPEKCAKASACWAKIAASIRAQEQYLQPAGGTAQPPAQRSLPAIAGHRRLRSGEEDTADEIASVIRAAAMRLGKSGFRVMLIKVTGLI